MNNIITSKITENFSILQRVDKFKFGTDAVLLSHFANIKAKNTVVDFCSGTGAVGYLSYLRHKQNKTIFVDIDGEMIELSKKTADLNNISEKFEFINSDIKDCGIPNNTIDYITVNPPYFKLNSGKINANENLVLSRHSYAFSIDDLFKTSYNILKDGGKIALIYRTSYLCDIISAMRQAKIEPKRLRLVHSYKDKNSELFLIEGVKNAGIELQALPPLILHDENGMTDEFVEIENYGD